MSFNRETQGSIFTIFVVVCILSLVKNYLEVYSRALYSLQKILKLHSCSNHPLLEHQLSLCTIAMLFFSYHRFLLQSKPALGGGRGWVWLCWGVDSLAELWWSWTLRFSLVPSLVLLCHVGGEQAGDQVLVHGTHVLLFQTTPVCIATVNEWLW